MNYNNLKKSIAQWIRASLPIELRWDSGTFTAGAISVTVDSTTVTQIFTTSINVTMTALAVKIAAIDGVVATAIDTANKVITFTTLTGARLIVSIDSDDVVGTIKFTLPEIKFVWENQNAPRPELPYISGNLSNIITIGDDFIDLPNAAGVNQIVGIREMTLSLQAFGPDALSVLNSLKEATLREGTKASFFAIGLIYLDDNGIIDLPSLLESHYEPRAVTDWRIRTSQSVIDAPGFIENVRIETTFLDANSDESLVDLITITI